MPRGRLPTNFFAEETFNLKPKPKEDQSVSSESWLSPEPEGQLAIDVSETPQAVIITAPIAGVKPEDLEIFVSNDLVTIRGRREDSLEKISRNFLFQECFWGAFSRSIILPVQVLSEGAEAKLKNGVLTITLPKFSGSSYLPVTEVYDEEI